MSTTTENNEMFTPSFNTLISPRASSDIKSATVSKETSNLCLTSPVGSSSAVSSDCNTSEKCTVSTELSPNHPKNTKRDFVEVDVGVSVDGAFAIVTTAALILISVGVCVWWKGRKKKQFTSVVNVAYNCHSGHMTMLVKSSDTEYEYPTLYSTAYNYGPNGDYAACAGHTTHNMLYSTESDLISNSAYASAPNATHGEALIHYVPYGTSEDGVELTTNGAYGLGTVGSDVPKGEDLPYYYVMN